MPINPDIRDQAYQFFIEEAPELLQAIESGLLTLKQEKNTASVHNLMRSAHSIKGGAASVELDAIKTLAHRLENIFKALYSDTLEIDTNLESQLLQAYDCLRLPLMEQISVGYFDAEQALTVAEPIFVQLEEQLGDALNEDDTYIPSSAELGVDMTRSLFEVDVAEGLERLAAIVADPQSYEIAGELKAQAEVFSGFAEFLNQPEFGAIAQTTLTALEAHPHRALEITQLALVDFERARLAVLDGSASGRISPTPALAALAKSGTMSVPDTTIPTAELIPELEPNFAEIENAIPSLEDIFGSAIATPDVEEFFISPQVLDDALSVDEQEESLAAEWLDSDIDFIPEAEELFMSVQSLDEASRVDEQDEHLAIASTFLDSQIDFIVEANTDAFDYEVVELEQTTDTILEVEAAAQDTLSLEPEVCDNAVVASELEAPTSSAIVPVPSTFPSLQNQLSANSELTEVPETLEIAVQKIEEIFDSLPAIAPLEAVPQESQNIPAPTSKVNPKSSPTTASTSETAPTSNLSVRVDLERLGRMNNLVGELAINRNSLSLQNDQMQGSVRELLNRFSRVRNLVSLLRKQSDQMLIAPERYSYEKAPRWANNQERNSHPIRTDFDDFDALELDSYGALHSQLQGLLEEMMQLEESVDDIVLFARATDQTLERQRQMLTQLRDELMWARMLPLGEVLNRFPRMLRDLSTAYHKPVKLKLNGTGVLVDKAILEKLYDPLLHLIRNGFDHGIEFPEVRRQQGKPEQGQIEIHAYHKGSQTIIEVSDDGRGLDVERISHTALKMGLLETEQLATMPNSRLFNLIFEPGFSTASVVSELSGRGVGLDVVRSQLRSLKGTIAVSSEAGVGTTFTLRLPLTLTIAKLLVCFIGSTALALPSDSIEEIMVPKPEQIKQSGTKQYLHWRRELVPTHRLGDLLEYACPVPDASSTRALLSVPTPGNWAKPMLILRQEQNLIALEIDRLVTEQELVIKPFGSAIAPPSCTYGCTILGDGSVIPVVDLTVLAEQLLGQTQMSTAIELVGASAIALKNNSSANKTKTAPHTLKAPTVLVVDDAAALRRTLALSLERVGIRVLQAKDGREAIAQLQQSSSIELVICDIEMPNMNGFEFLSHRRQDPQFANIPVVMLTSRSNDKHRWLAMQLGANAYFTKPYLEQEFLGAIKQLLEQHTTENSAIEALIGNR